MSVTVRKIEATMRLLLKHLATSYLMGFSLSAN